MLAALFWTSLLCYLAAATLLWQYTTVELKRTSTLRSSIIIVTIIGLILHTTVLYASIVNSQTAESTLTSDLNLSLGHSISLAALVATLVFILLSMLRATLNLGLAILPVAMLGLLAGHWLSPNLQSFNITPPSFEWHLALGVISFSLLTLAFAQSLLILVKERQLKTQPRPQSHLTIVSLPPLQSMETLLFQLLWLGFLTLSLTLFFGLFLNNGAHGAALSFTHHIVLTLLTWTAYAILILGHHFSGWRGRQASIYTIICYSLLVLGYFGPRLVRELIIQ